MWQNAILKFWYLFIVICMMHYTPLHAMQKVLDEAVEFSELKPNYTLVSKLLGILKGMEPKELPEQTILVYDGKVNQHPVEKTPKAASGQDPRKRINHTTTYPYCCFCHVNSVFSGDCYGGSGVLIGTQHVVTAAHCLFDKENGRWADTCSIYCGLDDYEAPYGVAKVVRCYIPREYIKENNGEFDFALLVLDRPIGMKVGYLGCLFSTDVKMFAEDLNITGYPGDKGGKQMWSKVNKVKAVSGEQLYYDGETFGGSSGGPVWSQFALDDETEVGKRLWPLVVGIHSAGRDLDVLKKMGEDGIVDVLGKNIGVRMTEEKFMLLMNWMSQTGQLVVKLNKSPQAFGSSRATGSTKGVAEHRPRPVGSRLQFKAGQRQPASLPTSPVDYDPRINEIDAEGRTALHRAVMTGNVELVKALLLRWSDVKIADKVGYTALHIAVENNEKFIVQLLLDNRAEANVRAQCDNKMPLHIAFQKGYVEIAQLLIASGANVEADYYYDGGKFETSRTITLLDLAEIHRGSTRKSLVWLLFSNGISVSFLDAVRWDDKEMLLQLVERGADIQAALFDAIKNKEMLELLLKKGAKPQTARRAGATLLHAAVRSDICNAQIVKILLEYGADPNAMTDKWESAKKTQGGDTPLHDAVYKDAINIIEVLLTHGANPYLKNYSGITPIDLAKKNKKDRAVKLIKDLAPQSNFKKK